MAEPSNPIPSSKAPSSSAGAIATDLRYPENIGEPQADKPNVALFQGTKHEFFLAIHARETKQATLNLCYISGPG